MTDFSGALIGTILFAAGLSVLLLVCAVVGGILSGIALYKGLTYHDNSLTTISAIGLGAALISFFFLGIVFGPASLVCGIMGFKKTKTLPQMSYEEYKRQKAQEEDPEYTEYMAAMNKQSSDKGNTTQKEDQ